MAFSVDAFMNQLIAKNPEQKEFHQAAQEVIESLALVLERHPIYLEANILDRIVEPERVIMFRVPWLDDNGTGRSVRRSMVDGLDIITVWIEQVGALIARVIVQLTGSAIVLAADGEPCLVKAFDGLGIRRLECEMNPPFRLPVIADEKLVGAEVAVSFQRQIPAQRRQHPAVEPLAGLEVAGPEMQVVDQPAEVILHGASLSRRGHCSRQLRPRFQNM